MRVHNKGCGCAVQADPHPKYRLRDSEQRVSLGKYCTPSACTTNTLYGVYLVAILILDTAFMGYDPLPASTLTICQYAAFLDRTMQRSSNNNYLGIIALLRKEFGLTDPLIDNWVIKSLLAGSGSRVALSNKNHP